MRNGDFGADVTRLQRLLNSAGFKLAIDGIYGPTTEQAVIALQRRAGLVADGIAGPKTIAALETGDRNHRYLGEADLQQAADRLGVHLAAIKAINTVESRGAGFLADSRPVILYERHIAYRLLDATGIEEAILADHVARYPNLINPAIGGYAGGQAEWSRLASACQVIDRAIAYAACSWGQFQVMGYHWQRLGYDSIDAFVIAMHSGERAQLDAFTRFIEAEPALHKAIKARKWAEVARLYNGPGYKLNLYDIKLQRAYERFAGETA